MCKKMFKYYGYPNHRIPIDYVFPNGKSRQIGVVITANIELLKNDVIDNQELVGTGISYKNYEG